MKSIKVFELVILAFVASVLIAFTGAHADPIDEFSVRPLKVNYAEVPESVDRTSPATVTVNVYYANTCYRYFIPTVKKGPSNVIEIYPYVNITKGLCGQVVRNLTEPVDLGQLQQGDYLVRVHSSDGQVIDNKMTIK